MKSSRKIDTCIAVERKCAEAYHALGNLFPEAKDLFEKIAQDEVDHAAVLTVARLHYNEGKIPEEMIVPSSLAVINTSLVFLENMQRKIKDRSISLETALRLSVSLEETSAESYFNQVMTGESDSEIILGLKKLYLDEVSHLTVIKNFLKSGSL